MDQVTDSVNNSGGLAFVRGCSEGISRTESTAWVRGDCFPRHVEVVTKFPVSGNSILASVDQCNGRVYLNIGLIVPEDRTLCYPENGEYPQGRGQLYALRSKPGQIYSKTYDFNCNNGNSPQKLIKRHDCEITAGLKLRIYCYVKEEGLYFSINGEEQFVSTCGKQELNSCYGFMRLGCDDNDSEIQVSLLSVINDEAASPVVGSRENVTAPSNRLGDLPISVGRKSHETLAEVVSLKTALRNPLRYLFISLGRKISEAFAKRYLLIPVGSKISEAAPSVVGSRENVTAPSNRLGDLPISVGRKSHEKNQLLSSHRMSRRGICLLINNVKNLTGEENLLTKLFTSLGFHVEVKQDLSKNEIIGVAQEFGEKDHSSYDSFVFILLSKCRQDGVIVDVDREEVTLEKVMLKFRPSNSTSLRNKPKLFFVLKFVDFRTQSTKRRNGGTEFCTDVNIALPNSCNTSIQEVCPEEADFFLLCAPSPIVKGKKIEQTEHSFTEMLVNAVRRYHQKYDLLEMLTLLNHWTDKLRKRNGQSNAMVPYVTHTLRHKVRFDSVETHEPQISTQCFIPGLSSLSRYDEHKTECPGYCLIINNRQFQGNDEAYRQGSEQDVERLTNLFESLRFEVIIKRDLERYQIEGVAKEYGGKNHDKFVVFVLIVMSHGKDEDHILGVDNKSVSVGELMEEFQAERCPSLKGKPKILIIQTCRGSRQSDVERLDDFGESINADPTEFHQAGNRVDPISPDSTLPKSVFPLETDFLLAFATVPDYVSFRSRTSGAFFIQELVEVIEKYHGSHHLLEMLTEVTRRVIDHQDRKFDPARERVQVPAPTHTLTKLLYL